MGAGLSPEAILIITLIAIASWLGGEAVKGAKWVGHKVVAGVERTGCEVKHVFGGKPCGHAGTPAPSTDEGE